MDNRHLLFSICAALLAACSHQHNGEATTRNAGSVASDAPHARPKPNAAPDKNAAIQEDAWRGLQYRGQAGFCGFVGTVVRADWIGPEEARRRLARKARVDVSRMPLPSEKLDLEIRIERVLWKGKSSVPPAAARAQASKVQPTEFDWVKVGQTLRYSVPGPTTSPPKSGSLIFSVKKGQTYAFVTTRRIISLGAMLVACTTPEHASENK